jgi:hypothetical protein
VVKSAIKTWESPTKSPTANGRWVGSFLEESIKDHLKVTIPSYIERFGGAIEYPDVSLKDEAGIYAFEIKATEKDAHINNRTKSPESMVKHYHRFKEHWIIAPFYRLDREEKRFSDIEVLYIELWKYTSASFKDYSALAALGKLAYMLRKQNTSLAFRSEQEFIGFFTYMSKHPGPIIERNRLAKEWLKQYRVK